MRLVLALLLVASLAAPAGAAAGSPVADGALERTSSVDGAATAERTGGTNGAATLDDADDDTILQTQRLHRTPERRGEFESEVRVDLPDDVTAFTLRLPEAATVRSTDGFERAGDNEYEWTGGDRSPSLTFAVSANETRDARRSERDAGHVFVDAGEWALVRVPGLGAQWSWRGDGTVGLERTAVVAGAGATGGEIAFLGEYAEHERSGDDQRFRLIVPEAASMAESPEDILDSLENASRRLHVGERDREVFVVAAPTDDADWATRGLQLGPDDAWVLDSATLDRPDNVWLHEYVHTRQEFATTSETRWLREATAEYYAALLALEQGHVEFDRFARFLGAGERSPYADAVLAEPETWDETDADYVKGALVVGELDRRIRVATDGESGFQSAFRRTNERDGELSASAFADVLERVGGTAVRDRGVRYATTEDAPAVWDVDQHRAAFGTLPAVFEYRVDGYAVSGPYRDGTLPDGTPLVVGETLRATVVVENVGGTTGEYDATLRANGTVVDRRSERLDPGERTTVTLVRTFGAPGEYGVTAGGETRTVAVREPARASVVGLDATRRWATVGERVTLTATVRNDASRPAEREVAIRVDGRVVGTKTVRLDAGAEQTVSVTTRFDEGGRHEITAGAADPVVVSVGARAWLPTRRPALVGGAVLATLAALVAFGRRRQ